MNLKTKAGNTLHPYKIDLFTSDGYKLTFLELALSSNKAVNQAMQKYDFHKLFFVYGQITYVQPDDYFDDMNIILLNETIF